MLRLGIVGLPNVGKSTLFNALTSAGALVANYPFATIEPNTGVVTVPDPRLDQLALIVKPERTVPAAVEFLDIAGLVKGASQGEGLGNQFLANIREVDAVVHVIRCFDDEDIQHVMGSVDPARDREVINIELQLADLAAVEKRLDKTARVAKSGDPQAKIEVRLLTQLRDALAEGTPARTVVPTEEELPYFRGFNLLTAKPVLYAANVLESEIAGGNAHVEALRRAVTASGEEAEIVIFSGKVEAELAELPPEDRGEFLASLGATESGLDRLAKAAYHLLGLQSYFTAGEKEVRAWTIHRGERAPAGGRRHSLGLRERVHPGRDGGLRRVHPGGRLETRAGAGAGPGRRQGVRRAGRRRAAVPVQQLARPSASGTLPGATPVSAPAGW